MAVHRLCYVYVMGCVGSDDFCKIGISDDPMKRLATLNTASPFRLFLAHSLTAASRDKASEIEAKAHELAASRRANGEWFDLPADAGALIVKAAAKLLAAPPCPTRLQLIKSHVLRIGKHA